MYESAHIAGHIVWQTTSILRESDISASKELPVTGDSRSSALQA